MAPSSKLLSISAGILSIPEALLFFSSFIAALTSSTSTSGPMSSSFLGISSSTSWLSCIYLDYHAKAMPGADADTDHNLVIMRAQIKLKFIKRKKTIKHRWNNKNLKERSNELGRKIEENLTESDGNSIEERWKRLKENIIESAMDIVGAEERMPARKPWITKEMVDEMEERRKWKHQSTDKARQE